MFIPLIIKLLIRYHYKIEQWQLSIMFLFQLVLCSECFLFCKDYAMNSETNSSYDLWVKHTSIHYIIF